MGLKDRLLKAGNKLSKPLDESDIFDNTDFSTTEIPIIDIALSGEIGLGLSRGLTTIAGPSKHFKTMLGLLTVKGYMDKHKDAICLFYDSEFGASQSYWESFDIDPERVIHNPIETLEQFRTDLTRSLEEIERGDKVIIFVDSIGNVPSKKEVDDAMSGSEAADMTRAKVVKSLTRIAGLSVNIKNIPMVVIGHTYGTMEMYSKQVLSGGTGLYYNCNNILFVGRRQSKKNGKVEGYEFILNIEKSRFVKEGVKLPFKVTYDEGIYPYSGLLEFALEGGYVTKPKVGWYTRSCMDNDKNFREKEVDMSKDFWKPIFENTDFLEYVKKSVQLGSVIFREEEEANNE